jgi:hypothetical protein
MTSYVSFDAALHAQDAALSKSVVALAKSAPRSQSRAFWYSEIRKRAARIREPHESISAAVTKFITKHADGIALHSAMSVAGGPSYIVDKGSMDTAMPDLSDGDDPGADDRSDDAPSFTSLVDEHQKQFPKLSRSESIDHVAASSAGRRAMNIEKRRRIGKAGPMNSTNDRGSNRDNAVPAPSRELMHNGGISRTVATRGAATRSMPSGNETYDDTNDSDDTSLSQMVDGCVAQTGMSRGAATLAVMRSKKGAAAYGRERTQRLNKSIGHYRS